MTDKQTLDRTKEAQALLGPVTDAMQAAKEAAARRIPLDLHRFVVRDVIHAIRDGRTPSEDELHAKKLILRSVDWPGTSPLTDFERRWLDSWWSARQAA
jgi:hypothetical protein